MDFYSFKDPIGIVWTDFLLPLNRLSLLCNCCLVAVILIFCLGSKEVFAESNGQISVNATKSMVMDEMVVNGTKKERDFRIGDVDLESSPIFFSVINKEQFEGKIVSLAEVIEKEAGVQVRQSGGLGSFSSVSLRGSSSDQVMVFLDGVLLNDASGGGVDLSNISLSDVESIEIYRGITPANFGRSSIGGAINIRTNRAKKGFKGNVSAGYASFHTKKGSLFINHKPDKWDYLISADVMETANDFEFVNDKGTDWNLDDDEEEERNNAAVEQYNLLSKFGYDFSDDLRLELNNQWFSKDQELPNWNNSPLVDTTLDTERNMTTLGLIADNITPLKLNTHFKINHTWKEEIYDDSDGSVGLGKQKDKYTTKRTGGSVYAEWLTSSNTLSLYAEFIHEDYEPEDLLQDTDPRDSCRDYISVVLQDNWYLFRERLILTPSLRYTWLHDELESASDYWGKTLHGKSRRRDYLDPQLGIKYKLLDWLTLKANWGEYVREPSFFELFGDRGLFLGNMDLDAEEGMNLDCGFEIDHGFSSGPVQHIKLEAAFFYSDVDNLITRTYNARGIGKSVNISSSEIKGLEAGLELDVLQYFRLIGKGTWQDTENQSDIKAFDGKDLPGRYEKSYLGRVEARVGDCKLYLEKIAEKGRYFDTANLLEAEDKKETNLGLSWSYKDMLLNFEARNIGDNQYEDFNGYPLPGRSYSASIKYSF